MYLQVLNTARAPFVALKGSLNHARYRIKWRHENTPGDTYDCVVVTIVPKDLNYQLKYALGQTSAVNLIRHACRQGLHRPDICPKGIARHLILR